MVNSDVCCSSVSCSLNYFSLIVFVLHKRRNFFSVAHFLAAIVVFSARFGAAFCCFNLAFFWSTYVRPLCPFSLLGFVTFVFFTLRCPLLLILRCHLFSSWTHALSYAIFHFSYMMKPVGETWLILLSVVLPSFVLWIIIRQYFTSYISSWTSSLLRTSVLPLLSFVRVLVLPSAASTLPPFEARTFVRFLTFLYWVLSLSYFWHLAVSYFSYFAVTFCFFIKSCAFSYYLSLLLPD